MNKQELQNEINKTKEHLADMEKLLEECKHKRWKPVEGDKYYYISEKGTAIETHVWAECITNGHYKFYNCFKTIEQAEAEAEKILIRRKLEDIARRLNKGRKINWNDDLQSKFYIDYDSKKDEVGFCYIETYKAQGTIYCLDKSFKDVAIQEIGEERLKKYLRGE